MSKAFYRSYFSILTSLFLALTFSERLLVGEVKLIKVALIVVIAAYISFVPVGSMPVKLSMILSPLAATAGVIFIGKDSIREWGVDFVHTCIMHTVFYDEIPVSYEYGMVILLAIGGCIAGFVFEKIAVSKYICAVLLAAYYINRMVLEKTLSQAGIAIGIVFMLTVLLEVIQLTWKKRCQADTADYIVRLIPFLALYMLVMMYMPSSSEPYDWHYTRGMYERLSENIRRFQLNFGKGDVENYGLTMAGFSDSNSFFGGVSSDDSIVMTMRGDSMLVTNIYLSGRSYDSFYGSGWERQRQDTSKDRIIDALETRYAVMMYDNEHTKNYLVNSNVSVRFGNFHSRYTFMPLKAYELKEKKKKNPLFVEEDVLTEKRRGYGDSYSFAYYQMNVDHEVFYRMLEEETIEDESDWNRLCFGYSISGFGLDDKHAYAASIKEDYSEEIELTKELQDWVDEKTEGAQTDVQKLKMLEYALSEFEYTKEPGDLPQDIDSSVDFLEYFIFDNPRGYCTYFATAFTLLARAQGLPARYVEGFCVPVSKGSANVTNNMAHAWPEVYLEGKGWIPFEPTPGYAVLRYTPWQIDTTDESEANAVYNNLHRPLWDDEEDELQKLPDEEALEAAEDEMNRETRIFILKIVIIALASILTAILMVRLIAGWQYSRLPIDRKYKQKVNDYLRLIGFLGIRRKPEETFEELQSRIDIATKEWEIDEVTFLTDYEFMCYGEYEVTQEWLETVCKEYDLLKKNLIRILIQSRKKKRNWSYKKDEN